MNPDGFTIDICHKDGSDFEPSTGTCFIIIPSVGDLVMTRTGIRKVILREFLLETRKVTLTVDKR